MRIILFSFFIYIICTLGCTEKKEEPRESKNSSYLEKIFITINTIEKSQWEVITLSPGGLGPGAYTYRGYFQINKDDSKEIEAEFGWIETALSDSVSFKLDSIWPKPEIWYYSDEFNRKCTTASWGGKVYFSPDNCMFYFCLDR
jgi:hypothetical protein